MKRKKASCRIVDDAINMCRRVLQLVTGESTVSTAQLTVSHRLLLTLSCNLGKNFFFTRKRSNRKVCGWPTIPCACSQPKKRDCVDQQSGKADQGWNDQSPGLRSFLWNGGALFLSPCLDGGSIRVKGDGFVKSTRVTGWHQVWPPTRFISVCFVFVLFMIFSSIPNQRLFRIGVAWSVKGFLRGWGRPWLTSTSPHSSLVELQRLKNTGLFSFARYRVLWKSKKDEFCFDGPTAYLDVMTMPGQNTQEMKSHMRKEIEVDMSTPVLSLQQPPQPPPKNRGSSRWIPPAIVKLRSIWPVFCGSDNFINSILLGLYNLGWD